MIPVTIEELERLIKETKAEGIDCKELEQHLKDLKEGKKKISPMPKEFKKEFELDD